MLVISSVEKQKGLTASHTQTQLDPFASKLMIQCLSHCHTFMDTDPVELWVPGGIMGTWWNYGYQSWLNFLVLILVELCGILHTDPRGILDTDSGGIVWNFAY